MIALLFYIGAAVCLFLLMFALARPQRAPVEGIAHQFVEARSSLQTLQQGLLPADLLNRVFDRRDLDYIDGQAAPEIRQLFLSQRKAISLMWVRRVRSEILSLMHFHRSHSRFHTNISLLTEMRLALDFAGLLFVCRILETIFSLRGPYAAPRLVQSVAAAASRLCTASEKSLAFLNVPGVNAFRGDSPPGNAAV
ncbi:MAG: hypothetical protein ABSD87_02700 [Candidatus Acidiferrales bacterium]